MKRLVSEERKLTAKLLGYPTPGRPTPVRKPMPIPPQRGVSVAGIVTPEKEETITSFKKNIPIEATKNEMPIRESIKTKSEKLIKSENLLSLGSGKVGPMEIRDKAEPFPKGTSHSLTWLKGSW